MMLPKLMLCSLIFNTTVAMDNPSDRKVTDFSKPDAASKWYAVNDGVMGGRSDGRFRLNGNQLEFFGNLSLANNGGFASIRSRNLRWSLQSGNSIVAMVKGDGRTYTLNLYPAGQRTAFSYRAEFKTIAGQWVEVRIPLSKFVATSFGRIVPGATLNPSQVSSVGILLGDKKPGSFKLEVDSFSVGQDSPT